GTPVSRFRILAGKERFAVDFLIPVLTFVGGAVLGFLVGVVYLRKQLLRLQMDPQQLQRIARSMGIQLNQKQLNQVQQLMKNWQKKKR
ncbi:MAG: YneF family protein, partial [Calditerricola sp.]|nr:YneF family protein [Calditerricola sp.]